MKPILPKLPPRGVYAIQCADGRSYVGSSQNLRLRRVQHRSVLRRGLHWNRALQSAWKAMGEEAFQFVLLEAIEPGGCLISAEQKWMDTLQSRGGLFNISPTAGSPLGVVHTAETRAKMSERRRGRAISEEQKRQLSVRNLGEKNPNTRLCAKDIIAIRAMLAAGEEQQVVAKKYGVTQSAISHIHRRETWGHVS